MAAASRPAAAAPSPVLPAGALHQADAISFEPSGQLPALWLSAFLFAHVVAAFWLGLALLNAYPQLAEKLKQLLAKVGMQHHAITANNNSGRNRSSGCGCQQQGCRNSGFVALGNAVGSTTGVSNSGFSPMNGDNTGHDDQRCRHDMVPPVTFEWRNLCYTVHTAHGRKTLLQGVWGCALPCQLHGLLGPSGAGKSTLLDVLTHNLSTSNVKHRHKHSRSSSSSCSSSSCRSGGFSQRSSSPTALPVVDVARWSCAATSTFASSSCSSRDNTHMPQQQLLVNGQTPIKQQLMALSAYVPQRDNLVPVMTAWETVMFQTALLVPPSTPAAARRARALQALLLMGLKEQQHMLVGGPLPGGLALKGMSGGERKLLSIACGVVGSPSLLFLDEPTTGLDSCSALRVVMALKQMAVKGGAAVVACIHQPRAAIWSQLDQVTLLAAGRLLYTGPTECLVPWFSSLGYSYTPTTDGLVPDWALDLVSVGFNDSPASRQQQEVQLATPFMGNMRNKQELEEAAVAFLQHLHHPSSFGTDAAAAAAGGGGTTTSGALSAVVGSTGSAAKGAATSDDASVIISSACSAIDGKSGGSSSRVAEVATIGMAFQKYKALIWRELLISTRNPSDVAGRLLTFTYVALLWGVVLYNLPGSAHSIMDRMTAIYVSSCFYFLMPFMSMSIFINDKKLFAADISGRLYHPAQQILSKLTVTLPFNALAALIFHLIFYGTAGMRHGAVYVLKAGVISVLLGVLGVQSIYCCAVLATSLDLAFVYSVAWSALNVFVNPYMLRFDEYSLGISWLRYFSPARFAWEALLQIEMGGRFFDCSQGSGLRALGLLPELIPNSTASLQVMKHAIENLGSGCVASGDAVIAMYTKQLLSFGATIGILFGYFVLMLLATYVVVCRSSMHRPG